MLSGIIKNARYAFGPNRLHLCGPETKGELLGYISEEKSDRHLGFILRQFNTMYPYLKKIAQYNKIKDPFDEKVVEAYWIGNNLLGGITKKEFYKHLKNEFKMDKKIRAKEFEILCGKLQEGATMHHSFHVFNIWRRTGNIDARHTLASMDQCRISWGKIFAVEKNFILVKTKPLLADSQGKLYLGEEIERKMLKFFGGDEIIKNARIGGVVSMHWGVPCEILNARQEKNLEKYTKLNIALFNKFDGF